MTVFKFNDATKGTPKIGFQGGEGLCPGKYILEFAKAKHDLSKNQKVGTQGQPIVVTEWMVRGIEKTVENYRNWDGRIWNTPADSRRSWVIKLAHPGGLGDLNQLAVMLHGVDAKNAAEMREAGYVQVNDSAAEVDRVAAKLNEAIAKVLSEANPFLGYLLQFEVSETITDSKMTFLRHDVNQIQDEAAGEHNLDILIKAGVLKAA